MAEGDESSIRKERSVAIAVVLPSIFAIVLIILIAVAFILPKLGRRHNLETKEERKKKRLEQLESSAKAQHFGEWATRQRKEHPETSITTNPICVICLDDIEDASQIRGLGCLHVFHQECLDDWFARFNEYCPLCHRPIVEGFCPKKRRPNEPPPVAFLV